MSSSLIIGIVIFFAVLIGGAVTLMLVARNNPESRSEDLLQERLSELTETDETLTLEELEMSQPFRDRILIPLAAKVGEMLSKFTPQNVLEDTKIKLEHAGMGASIDPSM